MSVLVTGADGFMGSHLVEAHLAIDPGTPVVALVRRRDLRNLNEVELVGMEPVVADITRASSLSRLLDVDVIYHLAAVSSLQASFMDEEWARTVNFQGTVNLLNRAMEMDPVPRFVFVSTAALYGEPEYLPIDEEHPVVPRDAYTSSKLSAEITVMAYHDQQGVPAVILRPFNVYGPRQGEEFVVPTIIRQCLGGIEVRLGDGRPVRNFTFVTDAVDAIMLAGRRDEALGQVINLGNRSAISIAALAERIVEMTGCGLEPVYDVRKYRQGDPTILEMEPERAEGLLGWSPTVQLELGLSHTIEHYRQEAERLRRAEATRLYGDDGR